MSDSNNTSVIDEKKDENNGKIKKNEQVNIGGFFWAFFIGLGFIYVHYKLGSYIVYASAVSNSCTLPTDIDKPPFKNSETKSLNSKPVNIFDGNAKIHFPDDTYNLHYYFIDSLQSRRTKYGSGDSWTSHLFTYIFSFYEALYAINYSIIQGILKTINKLGIPQIILLLLGPLCFFPLLCFLLIFNWFYSLYTLITLMPVFVTNNGGSIIGELFGYYWIWWYLLPFVLLSWILVFPVGIPIVFILFVVLFSFLLYDGSVNNNNKQFVNGSVNCGNILTGFFENYPKTMLLFLFLYVISIFFQYLGPLAGYSGIVITILILYYIDKIISFYKNPTVDITQIFGKPSSAPIKEVEIPSKAAPTRPAPKAAPITRGAPKAAPRTRGGGNFDFLKELKKLQ